MTRAGKDRIRTEMDTATEPLLLRIPAAAEILGIPRNVCYELVAQGRLPSVRVSPRRIYVPRLALENWIANEAKLERQNRLPDAAGAVVDCRRQEH